MFNRAKELARAIAVLTPDELVRPSLGEASFEQARSEFEETIDLFAELAPDEVLTSLPYPALEKIAARAESTTRVIDQIQQFALAAQANPIETRDVIANAFEAENRQNQDLLHRYIAAAAYRALDVSAVKREVDAAVSEARRKADELVAEQSAITKQMNDALRAVQESAGKAGVTIQSQIFADEADEHRKAAQTWLKSAAGFGLAALIVTIVGLFVLRPGSTKNASDIVGYAAGRVVLLSLLLFGLGYSARQVSAHRHNEVVNRDRQNALSTFEALVTASDDVETKDAVLLEATRSIFTAQQSGYLKNETDQQSPNTILEIVRRTQSSASGA
jgi:hypothetical protein